MAEFEGNVLRPPGMGDVKVVQPPEEILAAYNPPPLKKGGTVKAGQGVIRAGEPMKLDTDGTYIKAAFATEAFDQVDAINETAVDCTSEAHLVNLLFGGVINAKVAAIVDREEAVATALGGTYIANMGYIKF